MKTNTVSAIKSSALDKAVNVHAHALSKNITAAKELRDWSSSFVRQVQSDNRAALAVAVAMGMKDRMAAIGYIERAWQECLARIDAANRGVDRVAAVVGWDTFVSDSRPIVLWQGEGRTAVAAHTLGELLAQLRQEPELTKQLGKQGANILRAKGVRNALAEVPARFVKEYEASLFARGHKGAPEHTSVVGGRKINTYALRGLEAIKQGGKPADVASGAVGLAQFLAESAVTHLHFAEVEALAFWVVGGIPRKKGEFLKKKKAHDGEQTDGIDAVEYADYRDEDSPYFAADETFIRTPFWGQKSVGVSPDRGEVEDLVEDAREEWAQVGQQMLDLALELDGAMDGAEYYTKDEGMVSMEELIHIRKAALVARDEENRAKFETAARARLVAKAKRILALAEGLDAVQKAKYLKAAKEATEGMAEALAAAKEATV